MSLSENALRTCIMKDNYDVSFENIHVRCKKCTPPPQITLYQSSLNLHKTVNENLEDLTFEQISTFTQIICTSRQTTFDSSNKFYALKNKISLDMLNVNYVHFKKLAKIRFLKY